MQFWSFIYDEVYRKLLTLSTFSRIKHGNCLFRTLFDFGKKIIVNLSPLLQKFIHLECNIQNTVRYFNHDQVCGLQKIAIYFRKRYFQSGVTKV